MNVNKAKNSGSRTGFEQMHLPWIIVPEFIKKEEKFDVVVKVGEVSHPMDKEHYLRCIRLYVDEEQIECRTLKLDNHSEAVFKLSLKKNSVIKIWAECNLHGIWEAEKKIILYLGNG